MRALLCCIAFLSSVALCDENIQVGSGAKVYKGHESPTTVTVVEIMPISKGEALIKVEKSNSAIDGLVIHHKTQIQGKAQAYVMDYEGQHTRMRADDGWWFKQYSLYLPENPTKTVDIYFDAKASAKVNTADILKEYKSQKKKDVDAKLAVAYENN